MQRATLTAGVGRLDRLALRLEQAVRLLGEPRLGVTLLVTAAALNVVAAADARLRWLLDTPAYLGLVGAILLTGIAGVAVRAPAVWREWRHPAPLAGVRDLLVADVPAARPPAEQRAAVEAVLRRRGFRLALHAGGARWRLAGVRRGWSRFAAIGSHLSLIFLVLGAAVGTAFAEETRFGLFPGEQSLLAAPRRGMTASVRLDGLDAQFDAQGRPLRFDTHVTFLRDGLAVRSQVLRVNEPGDFDGYLVHAWTYGPAVAVRVEDLGGDALFDGWVALGGPTTGSRAPFIELPQLGMTIGLEIADPEANTLRVIAADARGAIVDHAVVAPGGEARLGAGRLTLNRFGSYVTFLSRRDPGVLLLFGGAGLLVGSLGAAFYLPRRRVDVLPLDGGLRVRMRGERFERPDTDLRRLAGDLAEALR